MIGTNLGLSLPLLSDNLATIVSKTAAALTSIQTSIADKATPAGLNITSALSFGGNWATNVGGVVLAAGNNPTAAGSVYYSSGEFYMVDHTGAVKMTLDGAINVSGFSGIGGDYGGANPALESYDTASSQYRFYINGGSHTWADLHSRALILDNATGTVKLTADASVVTNKTYPIGNLSATQALLYDGSKIVTGASVTSDWTCQNLHAADIFHTTSFEYDVPLIPDSGFNVNLSTPDEDTITASGDVALWRSPPLCTLGLRTGDTITGLKAVIVKTTGAAALFKLRKKNLNSAAADISSFDTATWGTGVPIARSAWTPFTPYTIATGDRVWLELALAKATDGIVNISIFVTH